MLPNVMRGRRRSSSSSLTSVTSATVAVIEITPLRSDGARALGAQRSQRFLEGRTRYLVLDEALIGADTHPVTMHAFHGISARPVLCQWMRVRVHHRCGAALRLLLTRPSRNPRASISQVARETVRGSLLRAYGMIRPIPRGRKPRFRYTLLR